MTGIGALHVRRSVFIDAAPEVVWREFESQETMRAWFVPDMAYEPRLGARVEFQGGKDGTPTRFGGRIVGFDPPHELTFEWDWIPSRGWSAPTLLTIRLTPLDGGTIVEIFHHGFERLGDEGPATHRSFEAGWDSLGLERLRRAVSGI